MELFETFIKEKIYLANLSSRTIESYREIYSRWEKHVGGLPDKAKLTQFVVALKESGLGDTTINISIRSLNSYLSWLHENGHTLEHLRLKQIKAAKKAIQGYDEAEIAKLLSKSAYSGEVEGRFWMKPKDGSGDVEFRDRLRHPVSSRASNLFFTPPLPWRSTLQPAF
jgi:site-specific recombinase XerD